MAFPREACRPYRFREEALMVTIGVDAHKHVHQALALDGTGTVLGTWRGANSPEDWQQVLIWSETLSGPRQWGRVPPG